MNDATAPFRDRKMKVYRAEDRARMAWPVPLLDGSEKAGQVYVDRITRSTWWARTCPASWMGDHQRTPGGFLDTSKPPRRVWVFVVRGEGARASYYVTRKSGYKGWAPAIRLGRRAGVDNPAYATDPWVILHELAHTMCACDGRERGHGRLFAFYYMALVRRWLGADAARVLREAYAAEQVKYRLPQRSGR